jgi:hypothetical protein
LIVPGTRNKKTETNVAGVPAAAAAANAAGPAEQASVIADTGVSGAALSGTVAGTGGTAAASASRGKNATQGVATAAQAALGDPLKAPDCDSTTTRIKIPSFYAPNCVGMWQKGADNGGATYKGVTRDAITVALYDSQDDAQAQAIAAAGGATDETSDEEDNQNRDKLIAAYMAHFETYGRDVRWVKIHGSAKASDEQAGKADAIKVATELKAFISFGAPNNTYVNELVARGVMCFCTVSQPAETYIKWSPYVFSPGLMASTEGYVHRAEYLARLNGHPAAYAGDATYKLQTRKFAIVYYETNDGAYKPGVDFFEKELLKYNIKLADRISYILDLGKAQEDARVIVARLKDKGINSVLFSGDPLFPIFLTQAATQQAYNPEWVISGSALTDTTFFARLYDKTQWAHAFGISYLVARIDKAISDAEGDLTSWHYGKPLTSKPSELEFGLLFTALHLAGPKVTPTTLKEGIFSFKPTKGFITRYAVSYGRGLWPFEDYTAADDATEIWWDNQAQGKDELQNDGVGMYRYVNMGKRFLPGEWPKTEPKPFETANTTVMYKERPPQDKFPVYALATYRSPPAHQNGDWNDKNK